jgi:hypothetical protein
MELLVIALIVALVIYGLERNNHHHSPEQPHLHGSTDIQNRDNERTTLDLQSHA